jgi:DNA-directed RNA polymerase subunit M/transcription elongation factor TFIIS
LRKAIKRFQEALYGILALLAPLCWKKDAYLLVFTQLRMKKCAINIKGIQIIPCSGSLYQKHTKDNAARAAAKAKAQEERNKQFVESLKWGKADKAKAEQMMQQRATKPHEEVDTSMPEQRCQHCGHTGRASNPMQAWNFWKRPCISKKEKALEGVRELASNHGSDVRVCVDDNFGPMQCTLCNWAVRLDIMTRALDADSRDNEHWRCRGD